MIQISIEQNRRIWTGYDDDDDNWKSTHNPAFFSLQNWFPGYSTEEGGQREKEKERASVVRRTLQAELQNFHLDYVSTKGILSICMRFWLLKQCACIVRFEHWIYLLFVETICYCYYIMIVCAMCECDVRACRATYFRPTLSSTTIIPLKKLIGIANFYWDFQTRFTLTYYV